MGKEVNLINGFNETDNKRIETHLNKLFPYLDKEKFVIVGGLAIRYHLALKGIDYHIRPFNDLDIIMESMEAIDPNVTKEFMVYHYHPHQKNGTFYLVLIDPESKTKIDIFDYKDVPPESIVKVPFGKELIKVVSIEDQLVKTVIDIQRISETAKVDPKQFIDTTLLSQIADMNLANKIWGRKNNPQWPTNIKDAIKRANKIKNEHPEWVQEKPFRKPKPYICPDCVNDSQFPLTPMATIYEALQYVE